MCGERAGALSGLRVLEYGDAVSSAYCAKLLAGFGADTIKIERPNDGDRLRKAGPFPGDKPSLEASGVFLFLNTNKLGITLDLSQEKGMHVFERLCSESDVLIMGAMPSEVKRLRYGKLARANPRLILVVFSPFGSLSPYKGWKGTELTVMHMSGLAYYTPGDVRDPKTEPPLKLAGNQAGYMAGMVGAVSTIAAVLHREWTGLGQAIDVSERDAAMLANMWNLATISYTGVQPGRASQGRSTVAPLHMLPCKDGWVLVECPEEKQWEAFLPVLNNPRWASLEIFSTRFSRGEYWDALEPLLAEETMKWEKDALAKAAQAAGVPCSIVASPKDLVSWDHLTERNFFQHARLPSGEGMAFPKRPFLMSETPFECGKPAPRLGEHNEAVYCGRLGFSRAELAEMQEARLI